MSDQERETQYDPAIMAAAQKRAAHYKRVAETEQRLHSPLSDDGQLEELTEALQDLTEQLRISNALAASAATPANSPPKTVQPPESDPGPGEVLVDPQFLVRARMIFSRLGLDPNNSRNLAVWLQRHCHGRGADFDGVVVMTYGEVIGGTVLRRGLRLLPFGRRSRFYFSETAHGDRGPVIAGDPSRLITHRRGQLYLGAGRLGPEDLFRHVPLTDLDVNREPRFDLFCRPTDSPGFHR